MFDIEIDLQMSNEDCNFIVLTYINIQYEVPYDNLYKKIGLRQFCGITTSYKEHFSFIGYSYKLLITAL